jgi:hypothetical protein
MVYIGLSGKMRSGKDTAAQLISDILKPNKVILSNFSDPIYDVLKYTCNAFDFPYEKDRAFLQFVGTDFGRRIDVEVFTKIMQKKVRAIQEYPDLSILVGDIRFPNEADMLKNNGFCLIRIERPEEERLKHVSTTECQSHESEKALKHYKFDYTVYNDGSLDHLRTRLEQVLSNITTGI